jgi:hypothetical protein
MSRPVKRYLVTAAALAAAVSLATPQFAAARSNSYTGPISQPSLPPSAGGIAHLDPPTIEFKVITSRFGTSVWKLRERNVYFHCTDGDTRYPADGGSLIPKLTFEDSLRVKNGKFSAVNNDGLDRIFRAKGTLPAKGKASGTIRISEHVPAYSDPVYGHPAFDCDTGVLNWTARKSG